MPVSVHRLAGQTSGHIITDFFLPQFDFFNETTDEQEISRYNSARQNSDSSSSSNNQVIRWNGYPSKRYDQDQAINSKTSFPFSGSQCLGYCLAYHSRNKILASNCLRTNPTWMQDSFQYIGSRSLPTLMLPGTHNSATYSKTLDKSALNMINKYQMNQDEPIFNQLVHGIRHLDLRVGWTKVKQRPERLWIYHDIFRTDVSVEEVLEQVRRFLDLTSHEVIIMDFHRFTVGFQNENQATQRERHSKLVELIFKKLGAYIVPSYLGQHAPLNELVSAGKRLVVGYAARAMILGSNELSILGLLSASDKSINKVRPLARDIDAPRQEQEDSVGSTDTSTNRTALPMLKQKQQTELNQQLTDRRLGSGLFSKLKSLKLLGRTLSKRSLNAGRFSFATDATRPTLDSTSDSEIIDSSSTASGGDESNSQSLARVALFFPPVRHLWPDKDSIEGLAQYMNDTTCRRYFGELRSMMAELTPTVFGAISDKYDGNRRLAQLVNRPVTDWIRDRWLHCINIVASDYFLGNNLIRLSIYANRMRAHQSRTAPHTLSGSTQCQSFRKIGHRLDRSKIPLQFTFHLPKLDHQTGDENSNDTSDMFVRAPPSEESVSSKKDNDIISHTNSDGNRVFLKPVKNHRQHNSSSGREKRDSFVDNFSDGISNFFSSFKRLLNL